MNKVLLLKGFLSWNILLMPSKFLSSDSNCTGLIRPFEVKQIKTIHQDTLRGRESGFIPLDEESVDPATALALAKFAYDILNRPSGPGDPFDGIVTMLSSINKKLNTLNQKADLILKELRQLREDVEFKESYNKLKSAFSASETIFADYKNLIDSLGDEKGKQEFLDEYKNLIVAYRKDIWDARTIISQLNDPISANYLCLAGQMDYELGKLIDWNLESLKGEQERYITYFKEQLSDDDNSIQTQFNKTKKRINELLGFKHYEKKIINFKYRREHVNAPFVPKDKTEVYLLGFKANPASKTLNEEEKAIYTFLFNKGYTESADVFLFNRTLKYVEAEEYNLNKTNENSCITEKTKIQKYYNLDQVRYEETVQQDCNNKPVWGDLKNELEEEYKKLIIYGTALGNIDHSLALINDLMNQ